MHLVDNFIDDLSVGERVLKIS